MPRNYSPKPKHSQLCAMCDTPFETARGDQRFCSDTCRKQWHQAIGQRGKCPKCGAKL